MTKENGIKDIALLNDAISFRAIQAQGTWLEREIVSTARCIGQIEGNPIVHWQGVDVEITGSWSKVGVYEKRWFCSGILDSHWKLERE